MKVDFQIGIIGTGFGGLIAALGLKKAGKTNFVMFERASEVGGTWRDNTYPGCACDVPSHLYSLSSEPNPEWQHRFSKQGQIFKYMKDVFAKNDLTKHIRFNCDIIEVKFIESEGLWQVTSRNGDIVYVKSIISATGPLNRPVIPPFKGLSDFKGQKFHSAEWDSSCDFKGKNVAVIGTGASAIQIIPAIVPDVAQLHVFQRTPVWITPRANRKISRFEQTVYKYAPFMQKGMREVVYWGNELLGKAFLGNETISKIATYVALRKLRKEVKDPELRRKLTPQYKLGCKRILVSDDYYPTFNRPNVHLITDDIEKITENSIVTKDGQNHPVDIIVLATGFQTPEVGFYTAILGKNGRNLIDEWTQNAVEGYRGTTISGYPNYLLVLGPNTGLGHNSIVHMMESQMNYILRYLEILEKQGEKAYMDVKPDVQKAHNEALQKQFVGTVWASGCKSWYVNEKGRNIAIYPRLTFHFRREMQKINIEDYQIVKNNLVSAMEEVA
jgi:cation diffusion facilitator CzcD-associated flavoprotein CzcO